MKKSKLQMVPDSRFPIPVLVYFLHHLVLLHLMMSYMCMMLQRISSLFIDYVILIVSR